MVGLADTVAELIARRRAPAADARATLVERKGFGSNPGALRMWLHAPDALPAGAPLVVVLHGCGQTAAGYAAGAGWLELADRSGFAVLCPEQARANNPNLCFNWFEPGDVRRGAGEAASIAQMVRRAVTDLDLDPRRVFVTGLSAGGAMAGVMLAAYPDLFAAGAIIAGLPYDAASGMHEALGAMRRVPPLSAQAWGDKVRAAGPKPARWPRIAIWHGEADTTVTPPAADALVLQWRDVHAAATPLAAPTAVRGHTHTTWADADGQVVVELHKIAGLGHGTPIAAGGVDGCGTAGPWILEAGLSSTLEIARSWGLEATPRAEPAEREARKAATVAAAPAAKARPAPAFDVGQTISDALRSAGLLR